MLLPSLRLLGSSRVLGTTWRPESRFVTLFPIRPSVDPTLKYAKGNIADGPWPFFLSNKMESVAHKKRKQRLALAMRIERTNRRVQGYISYIDCNRAYILDPSLSSRYSKYIRLKYVYLSNRTLQQPR